ncbi:MAG: ribonuclease HI family protein [Elusimicrobiota bacterium]
MKLLIHIDGAARGNPGPASVGVAVYDGSGAMIRGHGRPIGEDTNNAAEYTALLDALDLAAELGGTKLAIRSDSQLLVRQFNGQYRVKNKRLQDFLLQAQKKRARFASVELSHVPREENAAADALANAALDEARTVARP